MRGNRRALRYLSIAFCGGAAGRAIVNGRHVVCLACKAVREGTGARLL